MLSALFNTCNLNTVLIRFLCFLQGGTNCFPPSLSSTTTVAGTAPQAHWVRTWAACAPTPAPSSWAPSSAPSSRAGGPARSPSGWASPTRRTSMTSRATCPTAAPGDPAGPAEASTTWPPSSRRLTSAASPISWSSRSRRPCAARQASTARRGSPDSWLPGVSLMEPGRAPPPGLPFLMRSRTGRWGGPAIPCGRLIPISEIWSVCSDSTVWTWWSRCRCRPAWRVCRNVSVQRTRSTPPAAASQPTPASQRTVSTPGQGWSSTTMRR